MTFSTTKIVVLSLLAIGTLADSENLFTAPVIAGEDDAETTVALAPAEEGEGRRSSEGERGTTRSAEGQRDGEEGNPLQGFRPQTRREAALLQMIQQLQREVAALRREVQSRSGARSSREGDAPQRESDSARREGDAPRREGQAREGSSASREGDGARRVSDADVAKFRKQFQAYDKNGDNRISLEERLAMRNYEVTGERLFNERLYHLSEDLNRDGGVSLEEFAASRTRKSAPRWQQAPLLSVDAGQGLIRVEARGGEGASASGAQSIRVEPKAIIVVKGSEAKLSGLQTGQPVYLFMSHDKQSAIGLTQR